MRIGYTLAAAIFGGLAISGVAKAALIDVAFTGANNSAPGPTPTGPAATGISAADIWNGEPYSGPSTAPLVDSTGAATPVSVSYSASGSWNAGGSPSPNPALTQDYLYEFGTGTVGLTGLIPGNTYDVYLYSQNNDSNTREGDYTVNGTTQSMGAGAQGLTAWVPTVNYTFFASVVATGGAINISFTPTPGFAGEAELNGLQVVGNIPEPASLGLLGLGTVGFFARRRRV